MTVPKPSRSANTICRAGAGAVKSMSNSLRSRTTPTAHLNPGARQHGAHNPAGSHLGDLPNLTVGVNGTGSATATLPGTRAELEAALLDTDGTAIIIHASADDYKTDPTGNSGPRVVCGVLTRS